MSEYDGAHRQQRATLIRRYLADGRGWPCHICTKPMHDDPDQLHLAHTHNRNDPRRTPTSSGLAHKACNIGDAGRLAFNRLRGRDDPQPRRRRQW